MLLILLISLGLLLIYMKRRNYLKNFKNLRGPKGKFLIGNALDDIKREERLEISVEYAEKYGKTYKIFIGPIPFIITSDANLIEILLGSTHLTKKSVGYKFFKRWWGDGLLTSSGEKWKSHRKILTPGFHYRILEDFVEVFERNGDLLIDNLKPYADHGNDFDVFQIYSLYTLDVICETAMGTSVNAQIDPQNEYLQAVKKMCSIAMLRADNPVYRFDKIYEWTSIYREELKVVKLLCDFSRDIIKKRRAILESRKSKHENNPKKHTFLDILLKSNINGVKLSDEDIREEVDTFLFEGHDTTAIALSFITYHLALHPVIQLKVFEEQTHIFGETKRVSTIEDLNNMKYLEMVIKESLRLFPSVPVHGRIMLEDLKFDNFVLPKGATVLVNQYALHRDQNAFPNPYEFQPERFGEMRNFKNPYSYIPFSAGNRNCIGQKFAILELKSAISKVIRRYEITKEPSFKPKPQALITMMSMNGIHIKLKDRFFV